MSPLVLLLSILTVPLCVRSVPFQTVSLPLETNGEQTIIFSRPDDPEFHSGDVSTLARYRRDTSATVPSNITTKINHLNDSHTLLMMRWAGEGSKVLLCLARDITFNIQISKPRPSSLYISYDYGDSFVNKTSLLTLSNGKPAVVDKFYTHPKMISLMVLTDPLNKAIFVSENSGLTFNSYMVDFHPTEIVFNTDNPLVFLARDKVDPLKRLWMTTDTGKTWTMIQEAVKAFHWSANYDVSTYDDIPNKDTGHLYIQRQEPGGASSLLVSTDFKNVRVLLDGIEDFWVKGDYMFATKTTGNGLDLLLSYKGERFVHAQFLTELKKLRYHVEVSGPQVLVIVGHEPNLANLYVSTSDGFNPEGMRFTLSLEGIFCFFPNFTWRDDWLEEMKEDSFADFHEVNGLRGIYIASQVIGNPNHVGPANLQSVITFDRGGEWHPLNPPKTDNEGMPLDCDIKNNCSLHLSHKFNQLFPEIRTHPILSSKSAPGVILASGTIGQSLEGHPALFLSTDAGVTWKMILKGPYLFNFGDHGGVIAAVKYLKQGETKELWYSTDMGNTFQVHNYSETKLRSYALMTEPGENTTVFAMFGSGPEKHQWIIIKVDLRNAFERNCTEADYKHWSPGLGSDVRVPCILGKKNTYLKRNPNARCYSMKNTDQPIKMVDCECDEEDFDCDYGFVRDVGTRQCIRDKNFPGRTPYDIPATCRPGAFYKRTKGYRKIPGDSCYEGKQDRYLPTVLPCPFNETKEFLLYARESKIVRINLGSNTSQDLPISGAKNIIALEFHMKNNCVYWSDSQLDVIKRQCLGEREGATVESEIIVSQGLFSVEGMALDWVSNLLYFVDGNQRFIDVVRVDISHMGRMRRTIHGHDVLGKPRGIAVHPVAGYLFWTDWSTTNPSVSRSNLDGSNIKRLFGRPDVSWPNGLTVDHIAERIYWVDAQADYIGWSDLDGKKLYKIIANEDRVSHPFGVSVFKDFVYWDDWKQNAIFVADKDHGSGIQTLSRKLVNLKDLKVYAHGIQEGSNACANATCDYICVGGPKHTFTCLCPNGLTMLNGSCVCPDHEKPFANGTCAKRNHTCDHGYIACTGFTCIPETWKCDGEPDCKDGSDEEDCVHTTCDLKMFQCKSDGKCIARSLVCDNDYDCADGSDEVCHVNTTCTNEEFKCKTGQCIPKELRCDGDRDCRDGSDEEDCNRKFNSCAYNEVLCPNSTKCIPQSWKCDGTKDCPDGWDEVNCANVTCDPEYFTCHDGKCMFSAWRCDGEKDCLDGSDEWNCTNPTTTTPSPFSTCKSWMLTCQNGQCIPLWWRCDGVVDCTDGSDEMDCPRSDEDSDEDSALPDEPFHTEQKCMDYYFQCPSGSCIPDSWVCDKYPDCEHEEDESNCEGGLHCNSEQFKCYVDGSCIARSKVCDGVVNCPDGSDELSCSHSPLPAPTAKVVCNPGLLPCNDECKEAARYCDGVADCIDGRDERNCNGSSSRIYQVLELTDDAGMNNATSIKIFYKGSISDANLEFLPSISPLKQDNWVNHTQWIGSTEFVFGNLKPFTRYNTTVYARKKGSTVVYAPAHYHVARTTEYRPDPPTNLTAHLMNATCIKVSWNPPEQTNGLLISYKVSMSPPVPSLTKVLPPNVTEWCFSSDFQSNTSYSFWVTTRNSASESASVTSSLKVGEILTGPEKFSTIEVAENYVKLRWSPLDGIQEYEVRAEVPAIRIAMPSRKVSGTEVTFNGLAPGETYDFFVKAIGKDYIGLESMLTTLTKGNRLPVVQNVSVAPGGVIKWSPVSDKRSKDWEYGVYFQESRAYGLKLKTKNTTITWDDPPYCKEYVVAVGLVGPFGVGPISAPSPKLLFTGMDVRAAPLKLKVEDSSSTYIQPGMTVSWEASCKPVDRNVSYVITVLETTRNRTSSVTFGQRSDATFEHVFKVHVGGVYNVSVSTTADKSLIAGPKTYYAPIIRRPEQVRVEPIKGGYRIRWTSSIHMDLLEIRYVFVVLVSVGPTLNESTAKKYSTVMDFYDITNLEEETMYTFAVRVETFDGYMSALSESHSSTVPLGSWTAAFNSGTSRGVYYVAIPSVILVLGLGAALFYYVVRHRRLQQNFELFANSHYDTRSGAATFGGPEELEDDDSPVIRGFSDDEPMVMA